MGDYLLRVLRGRPRGPDRGRASGRRGLRRGPADRPPPARPARSSPPTSAASTPWARAGPRARSATTSTAFLFVIFDVESVFLFPWATRLRAPGLRRRWSRWPSSSCILAARPALRVAEEGAASGPDHGDTVAMPQPVKFILNWGRTLLPVGHELRPGVLRHRVHRRLHVQARLHPPRRHPVRPRPPPGRPAGGGRHAHRQDGARPQARLRPDARPEVRDLVRLVLELRRPVLGLLLGDQGRRPDRARRRLRARAARRGPRRCCTASSSCRRRSSTKTSRRSSVARLTPRPCRP